MAEEEKKTPEDIGAGAPPPPQSEETEAKNDAEAPVSPETGAPDGGDEGVAAPKEKPVEQASPGAAEHSGDGSSAPAAAPQPAEVDWKLQYAHLLADFDNYKKRAARDRDDTYRYVESQVLKDLLPTVDNLGLALANVKLPENTASANPPDNEGAKLGAATSSSPQPQQNTSATFASFVKGVQLVYDSLLKMLKDHDAEPFDSVGQDLDTEKMEAIAHLPSPDIAEGKVSIESKKGWMLKGKVLRVAQVVVSSGKPA